MNNTVAAALELGLHVIINAHHDIYLSCTNSKDGLTFAEKLEVFGRIWT